MPDNDVELVDCMSIIVSGFNIKKLLVISKPSEVLERSRQKVSALKVINDSAEHAVKLATDFNMVHVIKSSINLCPKLLSTTKDNSLCL